MKLSISSVKIACLIVSSLFLSPHTDAKTSSATLARHSGPSSVSQAPASSLTGFAAPYTEYFDGVTPPALPAGWSSIALPQPGATPAQTLVRAWAPSPSNLVELLNNSGGETSDLLLISPELENINQAMIRFFAGTSSSQGSPTLIIGTMSNPADPSTFVEIRRFDDLSYVELNPYLVGLPGAPANARHIAFRHGNANLGNARAIYLDNFVFETRPACVEPSGLKGTGTAPDAAILRWDENGTATQWEVKYDFSGFNPNIQGTVFTVNDQSTCTLDALITSTEYDFYVRAVCSETEKSPWAGPALFRTTQVPLAAPFTENFESETAQDWDRVNGTLLNQWYIGNATSFEGSKSAYISNNGGASNQYNTTPPATMRVHLFRDITFPATPGLYTLKYWVKGVMEASDYLRVHFMETSVVPIAGEFLPLMYYIGEGQVTNNANWTEKTLALPEGLEGQTRRLVFSWTCNTRNGTQPPTAIDNIQILFEAFGSISGTAFEPGGQPAAGARIIAGEFSGTADEEGKFQVNGLPAGTYNVRAEAGGMATVFGTVDVTSGNASPFDVSFEHEHDFLPQTLSNHSQIPGEAGFQHSDTDGRYLYSPDFNNTLYIYDLLDPANPVEAGTKTVSEIGGAFYGQNLFVGSSGDRLELFDCSNPASLLPLSTWFIYGNAKEMAFNGNYAFVVTSQPGTQSILRVADCSDPTNVNEVSGTILSFGDWAKMEIDHDRNLLYILGVQDDFNALFYIFDISNPASPTQLYLAYLSDNVQGLVLSEGHVIITYNHNELGAPLMDEVDNTPLEAPQGARMRGYFNVWNTQNPSAPQIILTQALGMMAYILETSFFNGTLFAYLMPENAAQMILATFYFNAMMNTLFQGISMDVGIWTNNQLTFMQEPIQKLKGQNMTVEDPPHEVFYAVAAGQNPGASSPPQTVIKVTRNPGEQHTLTMSITPAEAAADGCTVTPGVGVHTYSEVTSVPLSSTNSENWVFKEWQGPATGNTVEVNGNVAVAGVFIPMPVLRVSGKKEKEVYCPDELLWKPDTILKRFDNYVGTISICADEIDEWLLSGFVIKSEGTGDDALDIDKVIIRWETNSYSDKYLVDNGSIVVEITPNIIIKQNQCVTFDAYYYFFINDPDTYASDTLRTFEWQTKNVIATPLYYLPGIISGKAHMDSLIVARVKNSAGIYFPNIQSAIDDATTKDGDQVVALCCLDYQENPHINKRLHVKSENGPDCTIISGERLQNAPYNDRIFKVSSEGVTIEGFTIDPFPKHPNPPSYLDTIIFENPTKGIIGNTDKTFTNLTVKNNIIKNLWYGIDCISPLCSNLSVENNTFQNVSPGFIQIQSLPSIDGNIRIFNNTFNNRSGVAEIKCWMKDSNNSPWISSTGPSGNIVYEITNNSFYSPLHINFSDPWSKNKYYGAISKIDCKGEIHFKNNTFFRNYYWENNLSLKIIKTNGVLNRIFVESNTGTIDLDLHGFNYCNINNNKVQKTFLTDIYNIDLSDNIFYEKIFIENSHFNIIKNQIKNLEIANCILAKDKKFINSNTIENGDDRYPGISMKNSSDIGIINNTISKQNQIGILLDFTQNITIKNNWIWKTLCGLSCYRSDFLYISQNQISESKNSGMSFHLCDNVIYIHNNYLLKNCSGILLDNSTILAFNNTIQNSICTNTGINLKNSKLFGGTNAMINNHGNGILVDGNSTAKLEYNNIFGNKPFGVNNLNPDVTINANNQYWGNPEGPASSSFSGNIEALQWLSEPVKLGIAFIDTVQYTPEGTEDSILVFIQNIWDINDTIRIGISDSKSWHTGEQTLDIQFDDSTGTSLYIPYEIPAGLLDSSLFTVTARSHLDNSWQATGQIPVFSYHPVADSIVVFPDSVAFSSADTVQFACIVYDQQGNYLEPELEWQASIGTIDSAGIFNSNGQTGICTLSATAKGTAVSGLATVRVWEGEPATRLLTIHPDSSLLLPGEGQYFDVVATDDSGFRVAGTHLAWSATSGEINDWGLYAADTLTGEARIVVRDTLTSVSDTAFVSVEEPLIPEPRPAPVLLAPLNGETINNLHAAFEWQPDPETDYFVFELATDEYFENPIEFIGIKENTYTQAGLEEGIPYFWRVKAVNIAGAGEWSETWQFDLETENDTTGVPPLFGHYGVELFPNPANDILNIRFDRTLPGTVRVCLLSADARVLLSETLSFSEQATQTIQLKGIPTGVYMLRMIAGNEVRVKKLIKK